MKNAYKEAFLYLLLSIEPIIACSLIPVVLVSFFSPGQWSYSECLYLQITNMLYLTICCQNPLIRMNWFLKCSFLGQIGKPVISYSTNIWFVEYIGKKEWWYHHLSLHGEHWEVVWQQLSCEWTQGCINFPDSSIYIRGSLSNMHAGYLSSFYQGARKPDKWEQWNCRRDLHSYLI